MQKFEKMPLNDVVLKEAERLLERIRLGRVNWFGYVICEGEKNGYENYVGEIGCTFAGHYGLLHLARKVVDRMDLSELPPSANNGPANEYRYDISREPACFDFIAWLVSVKMQQAREGVEGPTKIIFTLDMRLEDVSEKEKEARSLFLRNAIKPALGLFNCVQDKTITNGRQELNHTYIGIVEAHKKGEAVPRIRVPDAMMQDMKAHLAGVDPVTITLREHRHWTHRNSDLTAWLAFARYLTDRGEHVIFVRDTANADIDIDGFETMPDASKDLMVRAALYECAKCNFFVSNGPASLALFGSRPWIQFIVCEDGEEYRQNTPGWWLVNHGIAPPEQFPWCAADQRIVWKADTLENMIEAWEETFPAIAEAAE